VVWVPGELEFTVTTVLGGDPPPDHLVTSVRCIVARQDHVLVMTDRDGSRHILPGGRREPHETIHQTIGRELQEETGLTVNVMEPIGFLVFDHLMPRPAAYPYPYPRFIQRLFTGEAPGTAPPHCVDEWVVDAAFMSIADALPYLPHSQQLLLQHTSRTP
jgi:ADP-ribose pyrophosphatase YjhB (NUDIX family)